jgi:membrane-associated HD superfamily phosphohydrolase
MTYFITACIIAGLVVGMLAGWSDNSLFVTSFFAIVLVLTLPKVRVNFATIIVAASFILITAGITRLVRFGPNYEPDPTAKHLRMQGIFRR